MIALAAAHLGFWVWAGALGVRAGTIGPAGVAALAAWLTLMGLWAAIVGRWSRSGWLAGPGVATLPALWVSAPAVTLSLLALLLSSPFREAWLGSLALLPGGAIPALNALRLLALGTVVKAWRAELPRRIGFGVGLPDAAFGLRSAAIAVGGGIRNSTLEIAWHAVGAAILLLMVPAVLTAQRPPRLDAPGRGDARAILRFPLVLAPAGLALPFLILHLAFLGSLLARLAG